MEILYKPVEIYQYTNQEDFIKYTSENRVPLVIRGLDLGECTTKWTADYLAEALKDMPVTIHVSPTGKMSFLKKNFTYMKVPFDAFIRRASGEYKETYKPILTENEVFYFRSVSFSKRGKVCTDLAKDFPAIASDFKIPELFRTEDFFSSVFRIASPRMEVWTHYDVLDNILVQIRGSKKITLFSPEDADYLYMVDDKSAVEDVYYPDLEKYPLFIHALQYECTLNPGEAIYIPALWFHTTKSEGFAINVNVFWKNLPHENYDKHDVYGNRDILPAAKALMHTKKAIESLKDLPRDYRRFYTRRCIADLRKSLADRLSTLIPAPSTEDAAHAQTPDGQPTDEQGAPLTEDPSDDSQNNIEDERSKIENKAS